MRRRGVRRLAATCAVLVSVTSCGSSVERPAPQVLRVVMADDWAETSPVIDAVRTFEREHPGLRVDVRGVPFSQIPDTVRASGESGDPFDLAHWHPFAAAAQGLAAPLDDLWSRHLEAEDFLPGALDDVTWQGRRYGVPLDTNALVLMFDEPAVRDAGVDPATLTTFASFVTAARALTQGDRRAIAWPSDTWVVDGLIAANGGQLVEVARDGSVTFTFDAPAVVDTVAMLGAMVEEGLAFPPHGRDEAEDVFALFRAHATVMHVSGTWDLASLANDDVTRDVRAVPLPRGPDADGPGTVLGGSGLFVPAASAQRELAFEFIRELIDDDTSLALARQHGRLPARRSVLSSSMFSAEPWRAAVASLDHARPMRLIAFPDAHRAFVAAIDDVLLGRRSAADALQQAQRTAQESLVGAT